MLHQQIKKLRPLGDGLGAKVFRGGAWLGAGTVVENAIRFGRNVFLARLLAPEAFGTMAVVLSVGSLIDTFAEIGLKDAIIQNPRGGEERYINSAWWLLVGRALILYAFILGIIPSIAKLYGNPELGPLLRVTLISIWFYTLISPRAYIALKEMKFSKWAAIQHVGGICGVIVTVILSFYIRNVWALVIGYCAEGAARCTLSHLICPFRPSFRFDTDAARDLLKFSRAMWGVTLLNLVFYRTDIFVLAKFYSADQLGLYSMAVQLAQTPMFFLIGILNQVLFPAFSQVQDDVARINRIVHRVTNVLMLTGLPALVFVVFCGRALLTILYGGRYGSAAAPLIIACCVALINAFNNQITTAFYASGAPQIHRACIFIMAVATALMIYPTVKWFGIAGGQATALASVIAGYLFQIVCLRRLTGFDLFQHGKTFVVSIVLSTSVAAVCFGTRLFPLFAGPLVSVVLGGFGCMIAYGLAYPSLLRTMKGTA